MSSKKPLMSRDPLAGIVGADSVPPPGPEDTQGQAGSDGPVCLPAMLTIAEVGELHAVLERVLQAGHPVSLDGSPVESVDGAGLQLLAGFLKSADELSLPVRWCKASDKLRQAAAIVGLEGTLCLDAAA